MEKHSHFYNGRFLYPDPLARTTVSRSTLHRVRKKRKLDESAVDNAGGDALVGQFNIGVASSASESGLSSTTMHQFSAAGKEPEDMLTESELMRDYFPPDHELMREFFPPEPANAEDADTEHADTEQLLDADASENVDEQCSENVDAETPLFKGCPLTPSASSILLMKYKMRHNLTNQALSDLLKLLKLHCPAPNLCCQSLYFFQKQLMGDLQQTVCFHAFCSACFTAVESVHTKCPNLSCNIDISDHSKSYFIELPLGAQLAAIIES